MLLLLLCGASPRRLAEAPSCDAMGNATAACGGAVGAVCVDRAAVNGSGANATAAALPEAEALPREVPSVLTGRFTNAERTRRIAASWAALGLCATLSICVQLALLLLRSHMIVTMASPLAGHVLASFLTALAIELLQATFHPLVEALLAWQNHRSPHSYRCSTFRR